ncbi:Lipoprotein E precursor [Vibrio aerogenes CECT 7868]|uniref:Lipoprotein E n=1 Tax=Vibrio aerogenes CECT 7868 TaxID=1216006 RepID=A0A1M5Y2X3_9VIBR|nr:5'-nucleotidase, lipoprotein e(P4) family [Vibrio aerogenes]SHI06440.1 Lipoprotein E precursor [Vibrio aerogenes CECT 7868]
MKKIYTLCGLAFLSGLTSQPSFAANSEQLCQPKAYEMALRYQQRSAEIKALQRQTYQLAQLRFGQLVQENQSQKKPLAVVFDLDETVLDNTPMMVRDMNNCLDYTTWDHWKDWERQGHPTLIPGAKQFLDTVDQKKISIYYVSNRYDETKASTIKTLKALGLPQVSPQTVLLYKDSKEARRQHIRQTHHIIMLLGDSLPDFAPQYKNKKPVGYNQKLVEKDAAHFGYDWIVFPNAAYGSWTKASLNSWK